MIKAMPERREFLGKSKAGKVMDSKAMGRIPET